MEQSEIFKLIPIGLFVSILMRTYIYRQKII